MIPWERDVYIGMVNKWVKEETEKVKQMKTEQESKMNAMLKKRNRRK